MYTRDEVSAREDYPGNVVVELRMCDDDCKESNVARWYSDGRAAAGGTADVVRLSWSNSVKTLLLNTWRAIASSRSGACCGILPVDPAGKSKCIILSST